MIRKYIVCLILLITLPVISQEKPIGINNAGNTCFMNSALQCLYHSHDLTKLLNELPIDYYKDGTASRTYLNFLKTYKEYAAKNAVIESEIAKINWCVNLTQLIPLTDEEKRAGHTAKPFGATQDASELTVQLLEHLLINDINKNYFEALQKYGFPLNKLPQSKLTDLLVSIVIESKEFIDKKSGMPQGELTFTSNEHFILPVGLVRDLPEDAIPTKDTIKVFDSLDHALANVFNKREYSPSQVRSPFFQIKKILKLPEILILSLDRFINLIDFDEERNKIYNKIPFPITDLSFKNYVTNPDSQVSEYDLYGIVMHHYEGAHYTAYVKVDNEWYECDDFNVQKVSESEIKAIASSKSSTDNVEIKSDIDSREPRDASLYVTPYMLFYKQKPGKRAHLEKKI